MTRAAAAEAIGLSDDGLYKIEADTNAAKLETLEKLSRVYGCLIGDMLPNSGGDAIMSDILQPLVVALAGLDAEEMLEQVNILASQARLNRNAILRRVVAGATMRAVDHETQKDGGTYNVRPPAKTDELGVVPAYGVGARSSGRATHDQPPPKEVAPPDRATKATALKAAAKKR